MKNSAHEDQVGVVDLPGRLPPASSRRMSPRRRGHPFSRVIPAVAGSRAPFFLHVFVGLTVFLAGQSCGLLVPEEAGRQDGVTFRVGGAEAKDRLREALRRFANRYSGGIQGAATRIVQNTKDLEVRRQAILWRLFAVQQGRDAAFQQDALAALLDLWILCTQMREFFETGEGSDAFDGQTGIALDAARKLEGDIESIAELVLPPDHMTEAREAVSRFANRHPMQRPFTRRTYNSFVTEAAKTESLDWVFDASLAPLRAIGGMDHTAKAIHRVADVADEMNMVVSFMPERVHLQTQLLLYDPEVQSVLESVETISTSADRLSVTAEKLPEALSAEVGATLDDLREHRELMEETFEDVRTMLSTAEDALARMKGAAQGLRQAGEAWQDLVRAFHAMVNDFRDPGAGEDTGDGAEVTDSGRGRPFDVREYGSSAREIGEAAVRLREATAEIRSALSSEATVVEDATRGIGQVVDRTVSGSILVILALFGGALAYRVAAAKLTKKA